MGISFLHLWSLEEVWWRNLSCLFARYDLTLTSLLLNPSLTRQYRIMAWQSRLFSNLDEWCICPPWAHLAPPQWSCIAWVQLPLGRSVLCRWASLPGDCACLISFNKCWIFLSWSCLALHSHHHPTHLHCHPYCLHCSQAALPLFVCGLSQHRFRWWTSVLSLIWILIVCRVGTS